MINKIQFFALVIASTAFTFSSCKKADDNILSQQSPKVILDLSKKGTNLNNAVSTNPKIKSALITYIYTESNAAAQNKILCYKQNIDGSLMLETTVASGGKGAGSSLGSQGSLVIDRMHNYLFAVNAGDNTVSSFAIANDGSLKLINTAGTNGKKPVSLTYSNNLLYVVNAASDDISGFRIGAMGTLTFINGSIRSLSGKKTSPAQIAFSPNGMYLYVSEKATSKITMFTLDMMSVAQAGTAIASTGVTPYGFDFSRDMYLVITNATGDATGASTCTSYSGVNMGALSPVNGEVANNQSSSCWIATTKSGDYAYISNAGSDNISSYFITLMGELKLVKKSAAASGITPEDICVAINDLYVYNINTTSHTISGYSRDLLGGLVAIGTTPGLPNFSSGLVSWGN